MVKLATQQHKLSPAERKRELWLCAMLHPPALAAMYCVVLNRIPPLGMADEEMIAELLAAD